MERNISIGVDIGGSHITCAGVNILTGKIMEGTKAERKVDNQAQAAVIIGKWSEALKETLSAFPVDRLKGIGFAMPGPFDYVKGISYIKGVSKFDNLYGLNIAEAISESLKLPDDCFVRFMNDASSFAVGEAWAGIAANYKKSLAITLGTGFGSAFIDNRIPIVDGDTVPKIGCVYHLPYKESIADDYFSTRGLLKRYRDATGREVSGVKEMVEAEDDADIVGRLFMDFGYDLGTFLSPWLKKFGAEVLVMGGNISYAFNLFEGSLKEAFAAGKCNVDIAISALKEDAALLGSAYLLDDKFWNDIRHALPLM